MYVGTGNETRLNPIIHNYMTIIRLNPISVASSGSFRVAKLPGQVTCAARAIGLWVEKNLVPPPNRRALVGGLCTIVPQDNIVVSNKHN